MVVDRLGPTMGRVLGFLVELGKLGFDPVGFQLPIQGVLEVLPPWLSKVWEGKVPHSHLVEVLVVVPLVGPTMVRVLGFLVDLGKLVSNPVGLQLPIQGVVGMLPP